MTHRNSHVMSNQDFFETDPNEQLRQAWKECLEDSAPRAELPTLFHEKIREILDETQLTKTWNTSEIDGGEVYCRGSLTDIRGPLTYLEPWRGAFWRRTVAGLLLKALDNVRPPVGKAFWNTFQDLWCDSAFLGLTPPIRHSRARPVNYPPTTRGEPRSKGDNPYQNQKPNARTLPA